MTPGTPTLLIAGSPHKAFPGSVLLADGRTLVAYRSGSDHLSTDGRMDLLVLDAAGSPGPEITVYDSVDDDRSQDNLSVVDGQVAYVLRSRRNGANVDPRILLAPESTPDFSSVTWQDVPAPSDWRAVHLQRYYSGQVFKQGSRYGIGYGLQFASGNRSMGVLWSTSLTDWSVWTESKITDYTQGQYSEIAVRPLADGTMFALLRRDDTVGIWQATSPTGDPGTWSLSYAFDGHGYPAWIEYEPGKLLSVYRDAPNGRARWRTRVAGVWSAEQMLDETGARHAYASFVLGAGIIECFNGIEYQATLPITDADIRRVAFVVSPGFTVRVPSTLTVIDGDGVEHQAAVELE